MSVVLDREGKCVPSQNGMPLKGVPFRAFAAAFKLRVTMPCHEASDGSNYVLQLLGSMSLGFLTVPFLSLFSSASVLHSGFDISVLV